MQQVAGLKLLNHLVGFSCRVSYPRNRLVDIGVEGLALRLDTLDPVALQGVEGAA